jgi:hypothetical protein
LNPLKNLLERNRLFFNPALVGRRAARKADFCSSSSEPGLQTVSTFSRYFWTTFFLWSGLQLLMILPEVPVTLTTKGQRAAMYYSAGKTKNIDSLEKLIWVSFLFLARLHRSLFTLSFGTCFTLA